MSDSERDDLYPGFDYTVAANGDASPDSEALPMDGLLAELLGNWQEGEAGEDGADALSLPGEEEPARVSVSALMDRMLRDEAEPEPYLDLESLSIASAEPEPAAFEPVPEVLVEVEVPAVAEASIPEIEAPAAPAIPAAAVELPVPEPAYASPAEDVRDDGELRLLLGAMRRELAESAQPARAQVPAGDTRVMERFLAFQLAGESFAVPLTRVLETERMPKRTNVPGLPAFVMGVANLRGSVLPLVDLAMLLELESNGRPHDARILVVKPSADDSPVALVVDALQGVALLAREELHRTPRWLDSRATPFLEGIGSHKGRLLSVLDLDRVFAASELREQPAVL